MKSIQSKILVVVISGLFVMMSVVSIIGFTMTHEIIHRDADRILSNVCEKEAVKINDMLGDIRNGAEIMEHYATTMLDDVETLKDEVYRTAYLTNNRTMFEEIARNIEGVQSFYFRLNPTYSTGTAGFYFDVKDDGTLASLKPTDLTKYERGDDEHVGWWYAAVDAGKGTWLQPYEYIDGNGRESRLISYVIPFYDGTVLVGVIGIDIDFAYFVQYVDSLEVYDQGVPVLLGADGKTTYNKKSQESEAHKHDSHAHTHATSNLKNGMKLQLHADYQDIQSSVRPMLFYILIAFGGVLVVFIVYTIIVTQKIVAPLKKLTAVVQGELTDEKAAEDLATDSKDEIGTLSVAFSKAYAKLREYNKYINALAYRDSLTGIKNSTAYVEASQEWDHQINCGCPRFGIVVVDINDLKKVNDTYGHDRGNELIVHTSRILEKIFSGSAVFRIGGDEFVVFLQGQDLENYHTLIEQLDAACAEDYITVDDEKLPISVARGVALYDPQVDRVYDDVFVKADQAMYLHKSSQKNKA